MGFLEMVDVDLGTSGGNSDSVALVARGVEEIADDNVSSKDSEGWENIDDEKFEMKGGNVLG